MESIARALSAAMEEQEPSLQKRAPEIYDSSQVPGISVEKYLRRLEAVFLCGEAAFVGALVVLDRFLAGGESPGQEPRRLTALNVHRLFLACLVVTVKYNEDKVYQNSHYAKAGGIHVREVNRLERHLLLALDYHLRVQPEEFAQYEEALMLLAPAAPVEVQCSVVEQRMPVTTFVQCSTIEKRSPVMTCAAKQPVRSACRPGVDVGSHFQLKLVPQQ